MRTFPTNVKRSKVHKYCCQYSDCDEKPCRIEFILLSIRIVGSKNEICDPSTNSFLLCFIYFTQCRWVNHQPAFSHLFYESSNIAYLALEHCVVACFFFPLYYYSYHCSYTYIIIPVVVVLLYI